MASVNQTNLVGYAGVDCDMSYTNDGTPVSKFTLAVNDYAGKDKQGEAKYTTQWFNIIAWNGLAEMVNKFVVKGGLYFVSGKLRIRTYTGKDGNKYTSVDIIASTVTPLSSKPRNEQAASSGIDDALGDLDDHPF